jgi:hypothetical protein
MLRRTWIVLAASGVALACSLVTGSAQAQTPVKVPTLGYTLALPAGLTAKPDGIIPDMQWQLTPAGKEPAGDSNAYKITFDGVDSGRNFIHIVVHQKQAHTEAQLRTANLRPPLIREMPAVDVGGVRGFRFVIDPPNAAIIGERVIVYTNGRQYSFELNAEADKHKRLSTQFDALLKGVSFTK